MTMDSSEWHRIVHFDLKGWPPKMEYFINILKHIKSWGATGVLLEWEDTYPYTNELSPIGSENNSGGDAMYSMPDVLNIIKCCNDLGLEVIQLVQTMGHMEYVLKQNKFQHLREIPEGCSDLCVSRPESKALVHEMIRQVLGSQKDPKYFHIGADEVSCYGLCDYCKMEGKVKSYPEDHWRVYLQHLIDVANFIKTGWPGITVLVWDDMMRRMDLSVLKEFMLGEVLQPVVWNYRKKLEFRFSEDMWRMYKEIFPAVWAASAFKGANKPCSMTTDTRQYVSNQEAWRCEVDNPAADLKFVGFILTGWSRFDHFATMCEVLPTSMDSLAKCLKGLQASADNFKEIYVEKTLEQSEWPGYEVAVFISELNMVYELEYKNVCECMVKTYMNQWQIANGFINIQRVHLVNSNLMELWNKLKLCEETAYSMLIKYTGPRSTDEWVKTNIVPMLAEVAKRQDIAIKLIQPTLQQPVEPVE